MSKVRLIGLTKAPNGNQVPEELKPYKDWVRLDPNKSYKGPTNKKWGIINNVNDNI